MARKKNTESNSKPIDQYEHKDKRWLNNPPVGLVDAHTDTGRQKKKTYQYDPHLDPQLQWAGKAEHTSFEVPTVSLHVHERIDPRRIIETVKMSPAGGGAGGGRRLSLFDTHKKPLREAIEFYKHKEDWSNRLIAGDSLLVMNSLLEKEGMGGKVQMVYFDPPYGIKYGSNFQPFVNKRDVKDCRIEGVRAKGGKLLSLREEQLSSTRYLPAEAEIDEEKIEAFRGTESLPFTPGKAVAVKIIDARGIESLKIIRR